MTTTASLITDLQRQLDRLAAVLAGPGPLPAALVARALVAVDESRGQLGRLVDAIEATARSHADGAGGCSR